MVYRIVLKKPFLTLGLVGTILAISGCSEPRKRVQVDSVQTILKVAKWESFAPNYWDWEKDYRESKWHCVRQGNSVYEGTFNQRIITKTGVEIVSTIPFDYELSKEGLNRGHSWRCVGTRYILEGPASKIEEIEKLL